MSNELGDIDPSDMVDLDMGGDEVLGARYIQINDSISFGDPMPFAININGQLITISQQGARLLARTIYDVLEEEP